MEDVYKRQPQRRGEQNGQHLKRRGHKRHQHCRAANALQIAQIKRQARAQQNQHQCQLPQNVRNGQDGRIEQAEDVYKRQAFVSG